MPDRLPVTQRLPVAPMNMDANPVETKRGICGCMLNRSPYHLGGGTQRMVTHFQHTDGSLLMIN